MTVFSRSLSGAIGMNQKQRIVNLIENDRFRMRALSVVRSLNLPDWLIAAGFVRNLIWDDCFNKQTHVNDIDVIYYCREDMSCARDQLLEEQLKGTCPEFPWSVKNQARMHIKNGDNPYKNTLDAMEFWPEKQTSIGVKLDKEGGVEVLHCFELDLQFSGEITRNPARSQEVFDRRVSSKCWVKTWPGLTLSPE